MHKDLAPRDQLKTLENIFEPDVRIYNWGKNCRKKNPFIFMKN